MLTWIILASFCANQLTLSDLKVTEQLNIFKCKNEHLIAVSCSPEMLQGNMSQCLIISRG